MLRLDRGWSQAELARRLTASGVRTHQTTIARIETGSRPASLDDLQSLADAFGVTPRVLVGGDQGERELAVSNLQAARGRLEDARAEAGRLAREGVNARARVIVLERELAEARRQLEALGPAVVDDLPAPLLRAARVADTGGDDVEPD